MSSVKCAQCGLVSFATDTMCKRCRAPLGASISPQGIVLADGYVLPPPPMLNVITRHVMKLILSIVVFLILSSSAYSQSGRRAKEIKFPVPPVEQEVKEAKPKPATQDEAPPVTAEKNQDYRCTDDGSLARILDDDVIGERVVSTKEADARAVITAKPKPSYTKEARRNGVQGFVTLKVLLSGDGKISRVRVAKGLPAGLTENAIRAACKINFKPAMKDGQAVSEWVIAEYVFRLAESSIFSP